MNTTALPPPAWHAATALRDLSTRCGSVSGDRLWDPAEVIPLYRERPRAGHPLVASAALDLPFLSGIIQLAGPALLAARHLVVTAGERRAGIAIRATDAAGTFELRVPPSHDAMYDAATLWAGLEVEAEKAKCLVGDRAGDDDMVSILARASGIDERQLADALRVSYEDAGGLLRGLVEAVGARRLHCGQGASDPRRPQTVDPVVLDAATHGDGPMFVIAGATERLHDLVSPYVRRLSPQLQQLCASHAPDDLYDSLPTLYAAEPGALPERLEREGRDGITDAGGAQVLRFDVLDPQRADPRAVDACRLLKAQGTRAVIVDRHPDSLAQVLEAVGSSVRAIVILSEGFPAEGQTQYPTLILDAASGHAIEVTNGFIEASPPRHDAVASIPTLGIAATDTADVDTLQFPMWNVALQAKACGFVPPQTRHAAAVSLAGDGHGASLLGLRCLEKMAAVRRDEPGKANRRGEPVRT